VPEGTFEERIKKTRASPIASDASPGRKKKKPTQKKLQNKGWGKYLKAESTWFKMSFF